MKRFLFRLLKAALRFSWDEMPVYAASATFWMAVSVVPFLMVVMTALQFIPGVDRRFVSGLLLSVLPDLPQIRALVASVTDNLFVAAPGAVISLTALAAVWSASSGVFAIETGLMKPAGGKERVSYPAKRLRALLFTLLFVLVFLLTLVLLVLGPVLARFAGRILPEAALWILHLMRLRTLIAAAILFLSFSLVYLLVPGRGLRNRRRVFPGAALSAAGWIVFSSGFSFYFTYLRNISYMYGSLGAIVLLLFWMYAMICILFFGAELNAALSEDAAPCPGPNDKKQG